MSPSKPPTPSLIPEPADAPLADEQVTRQLAQLFGESLFGPWPELSQQGQESLPRRSRTRRWFVRLAIVGGISVAIWGGYELLQPGLARQDVAVLGQYAAELKTFLREGELERVGQYLPLVLGPEAEGKPGAAYAQSPHLELILFAEAALYRYYDGDPARPLRLRPYLAESAQLSPLRRVAALTLMSREERAAWLPELERLFQEQPNDQAIEYLRASALAARGDVERAREAFRRSAKSGPAWLVHRFEQAQFELAHGDEAAAKKLALHMLRTDPDNAWAKLGQVTFAVEAPSDAVSVRGDARAPSTPPVEVFVEKLLQSIALANAGNPVGARARLLDALAQVHYQPPFLLDAFDDLFRSKQWGLLHELVNLGQWPKDSTIATAMVQRLASAAKTGQEP